MATKPIFWEDHGQARERLATTYILHGEDVVYVEEIHAPRAKGETARVTVLRYPVGKAEILSLDDKAFFRFRKLPPMGWINHNASQEALFLERRPVRRTTHGLTDNNVAVGNLNGDTVQFRDFRFRDVAVDEGYSQAVKGDFPSMDGALIHIREGSTIAIDSRYAVSRDRSGVRWLLRGPKRVGLFPSNDAIVLLGKYNFLREELTEARPITVKNIQNF